MTVARQFKTQLFNHSNLSDEISRVKLNFASMMTEDQRDEVLRTLHEDLDICKNLLWTVKEQILDNNISNYPIFVASGEVLDLGKLVVDKESMEINWYFMASHLEEFAIKQIIAEDKIDSFRKVYKEHLDELCIFVMTENSGDFVFLPV